MTSLFAFFGIWQTTLAAGVGAISIPVIIHLLNRRRFKIVDWAAMRFLFAAQKQNTKRIRLEQIILLLIRTLLVALLVLAMAAVVPWAEKLWAQIWPDGAGMIRTNIGRTHHLLVLDGSLSMNVRDESVDEQSLFERARGMMHDRLGSAQTGDFFSVLLLKETPTWIVKDPSPDFRKVQREIAGLRCSHGNASAGTALQLLAGKLNEFGPRFPNQIVYFFTDLQHSTWRSIPQAEKSDNPEEVKEEKNPLNEIKDKAQVVFVDVVDERMISRADEKLKPNLIENLAVTGLDVLEPFAIAGAETPLRIRVKNFGTGQKMAFLSIAIASAPPSDQDAELKLREVMRRRVALLADNETQLDDIRVRFPAAGAYSLEVRLENIKGDGKGPDVLPQDDVRRLIVTVKDSVPVLMVNGKPPAGDRFDSATEFARMALNPFPAGAELKSAPIHPTVIASLADLQEKQWDEFDCIFLCDVAQFTPQEVKRLENFVRRGGGVVFTMGDRVADQMGLYNEIFFKNEQGLLPAILERKVVAPADHHFYLEPDSDEEFQVPPLLAFGDDEDRVTIGKGRFRTYLQARVPKESRVHQILKFRAGHDAPDKMVDPNLPVADPAMLEWNPPIARADVPPPVRIRGKALTPAPRMRGKVVLITTAVNMDWSNWPGSPSFGAMMQETARLGVSGKLRALSYPVGATIEEYFPGAGGEIDTTFFVPGAKKGVSSRTKYIEETNLFRWPAAPGSDTDVSGYYQLRLQSKSHPNMVLFAVNTPLSSADQRGTESDLLRANKTELESMLPGWELQIVKDADPRSITYKLSDRQLVVEERAPVGPIIARYALWLVLILALLEVLLAWKFGHYSVTDGSLVEQQTNWFWPIGAVVLGLAVAIPIGLILWSEHQTGEFLGFLPDAARKWVEGLMNIPDPEAGEGSHWELGRQPIFLGMGADGWIVTGLIVFAVLLTYLVYRVESPRTSLIYRMLLATLRVFFLLMLLMLWMPQLDWRFDRQGWPDLVILLDTSQSMGEPDIYRDEKTRDKSHALGEKVKAIVKARLPEKTREMEKHLEGLKIQALTKPDLQPEVEEQAKRVRYYQGRLEQMEQPTWRPTRLQLAQAVLGHADRDWVTHLVEQRRMKVHVYQLDAAGRAAKVSLGADGADINDAKDAGLIDKVKKAIDQLDPEGRESRLGIAVRQVIEQYNGASLAGVIMLTDGVTTRDETIAQVGEYAAQKAVPLFFVGIGDEQEVRDLKLHDLHISDSVYVNDNVVIEAKLTGQGYKDLEVPVLLKVKDKDGKEKEVARAKVRVDPAGRPVRFRMQYTPTEVGNRNFIIEIEQPRDKELKSHMAASVRLERTVEVIDNKLIKVLYVEGQPRYEFRYLKFLLERQKPDPNAKAAKDKKAIEVSVVLMDADRDFASIDNFTLKSFPATPTDLAKFDVVILGDVNPQDLGDNNMRNLAAFAKGPEPGGKVQGRAGGGGLLFIAGGLFNPHSYKGTPLADVMPIIPLNKANEPANRDDKIRLETTPIGWQNPIFRFTSNDKENLNILQRFAPMFWTSSGYKLQPLAEVLAVHPVQKADVQMPGPDQRLPLIVHHFVGSGRAMFFGFDETWRWRFRADEKYYNQFWIQTIRYLARGRNNRTDLRLDRQTPYRLGEPIKVTVRFPENSPLARDPLDKKEELPDVKVAIEYRPHSKEDVPVQPEIQTVKLAKLEGSLDTYEFTMNRTQEGKYRFRLVQPDVSKIQTEKPSADAVVEMPPGELDKLRMNYQEMTQAADASSGRFYTLLNAEQLLDDLPSPTRLSLNSPHPPIILWNHWFLFAVGIFLLSAEWLLRKSKHLL